MKTQQIAIQNWTTLTSKAISKSQSATIKGGYGGVGDVDIADVAS